LLRKWRKNQEEINMKENDKEYCRRYVARIVIETLSPLSVGTGESSMITEQVVAKDVNGLPYIPGTAIAGILRNTIGEHIAKSFFGFNLENIDNSGEGSQVIFSSAFLMDADKRIVEGILHKDKSDYLKQFNNLPIRQHVNITDKGTGKKRGKFDEEIVFKGTRFCFEMEMVSEEDSNEMNFINLLNTLVKSDLHIGSGTRSGLGEFKVVSYKAIIFDFYSPDEKTTKLPNNSGIYFVEKGLEDYIRKTSSLNDTIWEDNAWADDCVSANNLSQTNNSDWTTYKLDLVPDDFFLFGSGFGDEDAEMTPVSELYFDWNNDSPELVEDTILIPASSVKGAISHRIAFYYNKFCGIYADKIEKNCLDKYTGHNNEAIRKIFGYTVPKTKEAMRGNVIISDVIREKKSEKGKILNHVAIDRFTGGAIDSALFSEKVTCGKDEKYTLILKVNKKDAFPEENENIEKAFSAALRDISCGMLPLGGGVNRGHGCFSGNVYENDKIIIDNGKII